MKKLLITLMVLIPGLMSAQSVIFDLVDSLSATELANEIKGVGIHAVFNAKAGHCGPAQRGKFYSNGTPSFKINEGIMLTTAALGPWGSFTDGSAWHLGLGDDSSFYYYAGGSYERANELFEDTLISGMPYYNTLIKQAIIDSLPYFTGTGLSHQYAALEFDFVPLYDSIAFQIVYLGIGNWPKGACKFYSNGIFSAIISGPGYAAPYNIARVPGTDVPIMVNTINDFPLHTLWEGVATDDPGYLHRLGFCTDNHPDAPFLEFYVDNINSDHNPYSGHTTVLTLRAAVNPCDTYRIQIAGMKGSNEGALAFIIPLEGFVSYGSGAAGDCATVDTTTSVPDFVYDPTFCMIYPNPMEEELQIRLQGSATVSKRYQVRITDALGKAYYEKTGSLLSINRDLLHIGKQLLSGLYFLQVSDLDQYRRQDFKFVRK